MGRPFCIIGALPEKNHIDSFWRNVEKSNGCWLWVGKKSKRGYGELQVNKKYWSAHRFSYRLSNGRIYRSLDVLHSCDTPLCVNSKHLSQGTQIENWKQAIKRGRYKAKLDFSKAQEIRFLHPRVSQYELSRKFSVSQAQICAVLKNKYWRPEIWA